MDRERWRQIDDIFKSALELAGGERAAFVERACDGDSELRAEVLSLLAHDVSGSFIKGQALEEATRVLAAQGDRPPRESLGPYLIREQLGAGGMGVVYRAFDERLRRDVAIKLLAAHFTGDARGLRRFVMEAQHASSLNHPNIVTVHDAGEEDGLHYIVTEFVEGETLRERLVRGALPAADALDIATQIADALAAAHEAGLVHRDVKPENVMLRRRDGYVKVLDFGLAKLAGRGLIAGGGVNDERDPTRARTEPGLILGTLSYMSPEQVRGDEVDARTDIWSLGVVLYEMLAGRRPFDGRMTPDILASILRDEPAALPAHVPAGLGAAVARSLAKSPEERYQTTAEMLSDLRSLKQTSGAAADAARGGTTTRRRTDVRLWIALALAAAVAFAVFAYSRRNVAAQIDSLAVLPFANVGGNPDTEYFSDGVTESLIESLSRLPGVKVMSRNSVFRYKGAADAKDVAERLGVRAVLTGRVTQRGDSVAISVEMIDARDNTHLWGGQYNRRLAELIGVQDEMAREIAERLRPRLTGEEERRVTRHYTDNVAAYQAYLRGLFEWNKFTPAGLKASIEHYNRAIALDPNYALAYAGLSKSYQVQGSTEMIPYDEALPRARSAADRALALDAGIVESHQAACGVRLFLERDWPAAEASARRTIEIEPEDAESHQLYGLYLMATGRRAEARAEEERAHALDPFMTIASQTLAVALYYERRYDDALRQSVRTLELDPNFPFTRYLRGQIFERKGMYAEAEAEFRRLPGEGAGHITSAGWLGHVYAVSGRREEARAVLTRLKELREQGRSSAYSSYHIALIHAGLGERDAAFEWLERALDAHEYMTLWIKVEPQLDVLRDDPRFERLLRRAGLAHANDSTTTTIR